jgi:hypothetical protein
VTYNGQDLLWLMDTKGHDALRPQVGHPRIATEGLLLDEMRAARAYGYEAYWSADQGMKALMVAQLWVDTALEAMRLHDLREHGKRQKR